MDVNLLWGLGLLILQFRITTLILFPASFILTLGVVRCLPRASCVTAEIFFFPSLIAWGQNIFIPSSCRHRPFFSALVYTTHTHSLSLSHVHFHFFHACFNGKRCTLFVRSQLENTRHSLHFHIQLQFFTSLRHQHIQFYCCHRRLITRIYFNYSRSILRIMSTVWSLLFPRSVQENSVHIEWRWIQINICARLVSSSQSAIMRYTCRKSVKVAEKRRHISGFGIATNHLRVVRHRFRYTGRKINTGPISNLCCLELARMMSLKIGHIACNSFYFHNVYCKDKIFHECRLQSLQTSEIEFWPTVPWMVSRS